MSHVEPTRAKYLSVEQLELHMSHVKPTRAKYVSRGTIYKFDFILLPHRGKHGL